MKKRLRTGRVVLAAAAAAALFACGNGDSKDGGDSGDGGAGPTSGDGDSGTSGDGSSGDGDSSGTSDTDSTSSSGDGDSSSGDGDSTTSGDGDSTTGGDGDSTGGDGGASGTGGDGSGGSPPVDNSLTVDEACPQDESSYSAPVESPLDFPTNAYRPFDYAGSAEFVDGLMVGGSDQDRLSIISEGGQLSCLVAGAGDDLLEVEFSQRSTPGKVTLSGGDGADIFAIRNADVDGWNPANQFAIVDFKPGEDRLMIDTFGLWGGDLGDQDVFIQEFDDSSPSYPAAERALVVDPTDGEVWLVYANGEVGHSLLGSLSDVSGITTDDIEFFSSAPGCEQNNQAPVDDDRTATSLGPDPTFRSGDYLTASGSTPLLLPSDGGYAAAGSESSSICIAGNSGQDVILLTRSGSSGVVSGGPGADTFVIDSDRPRAFSLGGLLSVADFTPGEDKLLLVDAGLGIRGIEDVKVVDTEFNDTSELPDRNQVIVDKTDGQVWLAGPDGRQLLAELSNLPDITLADIEVHRRSMTAEETCPQSLPSYSQQTADVASTDPQRPFDRRGNSELASQSLILGSNEDDRFNAIYGYTVEVCMVAQDGDDLLEVDMISGAEGSAPTTLSGGLGADTFALRYPGVAPTTSDDYVSLVSIVDFNADEGDQLYIDTHGFLGGDQQETVVVVQNFDPADRNTHPVEARSLVIDPDDGEVWLAAYDGEVFSSIQLAHLVGAPDVDAGDILVGSSAPGCIQSRADSKGDMRGQSSSFVDYFTPGTQIASGSTTYAPSGGGPIYVPYSLSSCIAGNSGDDVIQFISSGESFGGVVSGGPGSDSFVFQYTNPLVAPTVTVVDFTPGEDKLVFESGSFASPSVEFTDNFDGVTSGGSKLTVDNVDGEVWYSSAETSNLIVRFPEAATVTINDIIIESKD